MKLPRPVANTAAALALVLVSAQPLSVAAADPSGASRASELSAEGSTTIAEGSLVAVVGSAEMVVVAVEAVGEGLRVTLQGSAKVGKVVLSVPVAVAGGLSYAAGQTVTCVAEGAGWMIVRAGEVIAFIPNEAGKALLHSRPVRDLGA